MSSVELRIVDSSDVEIGGGDFTNSVDDEEDDTGEDLQEDVNL